MVKDSPATAVKFSMGRMEGGPKTFNLAECLMDETPLLAVHCCEDSMTGEKREMTVNEFDKKT